MTAMPYRLPLCLNTWDLAEERAIVEVVRSGRVTMGQRVREFEERFAHVVGARHAVMVTSGSTALLLAAALLRPRSQVHIPAVTWITSATSFMALGHHVALHDVDPDTLQGTLPFRGGFDVPVHLMGNIAPIPEHAALVIEDSCERLDDEPMRGDVACYSFYFSHHLSTGEGGAICTNNDAIADELRALRAHGWVRNSSDAYRARGVLAAPDVDERFLFTAMGFNAKPTEIVAAAGLAQLDKLPRFNQLRREAFAKLAALVPPPLRTMRLTHPRAVPFALPLIARNVVERNALRDHLEAWRIETRPIAAGNLARQPVFTANRHMWTAAGPLTGADTVHDCALFIGLHPQLGADDVQYIADALGAFGREHPHA